LRFNVAQQLREPVGSRRHYTIDEEGDGGRIVGGATLLRTDRGILASVRVEVMGRGNCSRCLGEIVYPLAVAFEEEFFPTVDVVSGAPLSRPEDPDAFLIDNQHILDLREALRQYRLMAEPLAPLCRPDCQGLCPRCGHNLNLGPCSCPAEVDPRWQALEGLMGEG